MTSRLAAVLAGAAPDAPPIWLMRQAGRYQASYRARRARHRFETLCTEPELSAAIALAAVREFDLDAAILFSDLLFPLQALGMSLSYDDGPPRLDTPITAARIDAFPPEAEALARLRFQRDAIAATRSQLTPDKGLIGFVGGPWTLFGSAVEGTHAGGLERAKASSSLYGTFAARVVPLLRRCVREQIEAGADLVMIFDTAAGELPPESFQRWLIDDLSAIAEVAPGRVGYYAKHLRAAHIDDARFAAIPWAGLGYDAQWPLAEVLASESARARPRFAQGNFDNTLLLLDGDDFEAALTAYLRPLRALDATPRGRWICGLGHGVLPATPEANVRRFVEIVRESFR
jgi:uroporphyrinogen decarboxylase